MPSRPILMGQTAQSSEAEAEGRKKASIVVSELEILGLFCRTPVERSPFDRDRARAFSCEKALAVFCFLNLRRRPPLGNPLGWVLLSDSCSLCSGEPRRLLSLPYRRR